MNIYRNAAELIIGSRLKRLGERFFFDISKIYKDENIAFEPAWFPLFYLLRLNRKMTVSDIASDLEITHPGASQMITALENRGLINCAKDKHDKRIRTVAFTAKGKNLLKQIQPVWKSMKKCLQELLSEGKNSITLLSSLTEIEDHLIEKSFYTRIKEDIHQRKIIDKMEFISYSSDYQKEYRDLILSWLLESKNDSLVNLDFLNQTEESLEQEKIKIVLVKNETEVMGVSVSQLENKNQAEIIVFFIIPRWRNLQIEDNLLTHTMNTLEKVTVTDVHIKIYKKDTNLIKIFRRERFCLDSLQSSSQGDSLQVVLKRSCQP